MASSSSALPAVEIPLKDGLPQLHFAFPSNWTGDDAPRLALAVLELYNLATTARDARSFSALFLQGGGGWWRDIIAFTNDFRTIRTPHIEQAARDRLPLVQPTAARLRPSQPPRFVQPLVEEPRYWFFEVPFDFSTATGPAYGLVRLVPTAATAEEALQDATSWRILTLFTLLEGVHGHPELVGEQRRRGEHNTSQPWHEERASFSQFEGHDPDVVIIGAGHNGLSLAARLKAVGLEALIVDKQARVGDNWRLRYESLSLHDPVWTNHLSFMPFPKNWPVFTPAGKLANWLEAYVDAMDLNVWCDSAPVPDETTFDAASQTWTVVIRRGGATRRIRTKHLVLATGTSGGVPKMPKLFPNQDSYEGRIVHSSAHGSGKPWKGKKALVVGACTSAHDISLDLVNNGCTVTMLQRSPTFIMTVKNGVPIFHLPVYSENGPPTDIADRVLESTPKRLLFHYHKRLAARVLAQDQPLLDQLEAAGFRTTVGPDGTGWQQLALEKAGGYYFDTGASAKVADGTIKVQQGEIDSFTPSGVVFTDGSSAAFDTVIFATGYTGFSDTLRRTVGSSFVQHMHPVFGLDAEGETRAVARESGVPRMYWMVGHLALARVLSKVLATQILAEQKGVFGPRYTAEVQAAAEAAS
ncbi:hypothetical protein JCM6882_007848 [Rhodosporidiobolus microsporus]